MKKTLGIGVFALSLLAFGLPATAADGWYVSGSGGFSALQDASVKDTVTAGSGTGDAGFDNGFGLSGAIGHSWGAFRLEGELSYRENDLDDLDGITVNGFLVTALGAVDLGGDVSSFGFMANGFYDFDTGSKWAPFLMAGIGGSKINLDVTSVAGTSTTYDESDTVFAYQAGAGLGYNFSPKTSVNAQYRFFGTSDPTFDDGTDNVDGEYLSHNFWVGLTHRF